MFEPKKKTRDILSSFTALFLFSSIHTLFLFIIKINLFFQLTHTPLFLFIFRFLYSPKQTIYWTDYIKSFCAGLIFSCLAFFIFDTLVVLFNLIFMSLLVKPLFVCLFELHLATLCNYIDRSASRRPHRLCRRVCNLYILFAAWAFLNTCDCLRTAYYEKKQSFSKEKSFRKKSCAPVFLFHTAKRPEHL